MMRDPWKLVTSVGELRAGMTVELRPCIWCGADEAVTLLYTVRAASHSSAPDGTTRKHSASKIWKVDSRCLSEKFVVFDRAVKEGRLYESNESSD